MIEISTRIHVKILRHILIDLVFAGLTQSDAIGRTNSTSAYKEVFRGAKTNLNGPANSAARFRRAHQGSSATKRRPTCERCALTLSRSIRNKRTSRMGLHSRQEKRGKQPRGFNCFAATAAHCIIDRAHA